MIRGPLLKIQAPTAASVCENYALDPGAKGVLREGMSPVEFIAALADKKKCVDAIEFLAHALPAREGIWWGCLCMQHALGDKLTPEEKSAATAVVQWVLGPSEENRVTAQALAQAAGGGSPAGSLAMAVGLTGGSTAPPNAPPKPPPPFAAAPPVAMAVKIASTKTEPPSIAKMQRAYVELGLDVAEGRLI